MNKFRGYSWDYVIKSMQGIGWTVLKNNSKEKILVKKNLRLAALRLDKTKWKLDIFQNKRILDGLGVNDEDETKILICEFGVLRGVPA